MNRVRKLQKSSLFADNIKIDVGCYASFAHMGKCIHRVAGRPQVNPRELDSLFLPRAG